MKRLFKSLVVFVLAVALLVPMGIAVLATNDEEFDTLTSMVSDMTVDGDYIYLIKATSAKKMIALFNEESNNVRRIAVFSGETDITDQQTSVKTGDTVKIQKIEESHEDDGQTQTTITVQEVIKTYTVIVYRDVNKDGAIDSADFQLIKQYIKGDIALDEIAKKALVYDGNSGVSLVGEDDIPRSATKYILDVYVNPSDTVSYTEFVLTYPEFLSNPEPMGAWDFESETLTATSMKIRLEKTSGTDARTRVLNISFDFDGDTVLHNGTVKATDITGISSDGFILSDTDAELLITLDAEMPTEPTLSKTSSTTITINTVSGYQYYCTSSGADITSIAYQYFVTASGKTHTFTNLSPNTTYYIWYRASSTAEDVYRMSRSVKTDAPEVIDGPRVIQSTSSSITVEFGNFEEFFISFNEGTPSSTETWLKIINSGGVIKYRSNVLGTYTVDVINETMTFSGLQVSKYYIYGKTAEGVISSPTAWSPIPNIIDDDIDIGSNKISLPYASFYRYSMDGLNYYSAFQKTNLVASGTIFIQPETVDGGAVVTIYGLEANSKYTVYIRINDGSTVISDPFILEFQTDLESSSTPSVPLVRNRYVNYIAIAYDSTVQYRINNSAWTRTYTTYPTQDDPVTIGNFVYFFSDAKNPAFLTFAGLTHNTSYKIDSKYVSNPSNTDGISTVSVSTLLCSHNYGEKQYIGNTLNYTQKCIICGDVKSGSDTPQTPTHVHHYETVTVPSTCAVQGYTVSRCPDDGYELPGSYVQLPLANHTIKTEQTSPTCTENGITRTYCTVCGEVFSSNITPALGHSFESVTVPSTCTVHGYTANICKVDGFEQPGTRVELPLTEHSLEWVVVKAATTTETGIRQQVCTVCHNVLAMEDIPKLMNYIKNANGTGTYEIEVSGDIALVTDAAKQAVSDGNAGVRVKFANGTTVELDPAMTASFFGDGATLKLVRVTKDSDASGNLAKAGFDSTKNVVYELVAENAVIAGGKATVSIDYENATGGKVSVTYVDAQGKKTRMNTTYVNGKVVFETNHFSTYVVEQGASSGGANAGVIIAIVAVAAVILATAGAFGYMVYTSKKSKQKKIRF